LRRFVSPDHDKNIKEPLFVNINSNYHLDDEENERNIGFLLLCNATEGLYEQQRRCERTKSWPRVEDIRMPLTDWLEIL